MAAPDAGRHKRHTVMKRTSNKNVQDWPKFEINFATFGSTECSYDLRPCECVIWTVVVVGLYSFRLVESKLVVVKGGPRHNEPRLTRQITCFGAGTLSNMCVCVCVSELVLVGRRQIETGR